MHEWSFWILETLQMLTQWSVPRSCAEGTGLFLWTLPVSYVLPCPIHAMCMAQGLGVPQIPAKLVSLPFLWLAEAQNGKIS